MGIFVGQKQQLSNDQVGAFVVNATRDEDDPVFEQARENIHLALAAAGAFDHKGYSLILCGGAKGKRYLLPNSRTLLHQPMLSGMMQGSATDLSIEAEEIVRLRKCLYNIISARSGKSLKQVEKDCDRNKWLDAGETIEYGLADQIFERMPASK